MPKNAMQDAAVGDGKKAKKDPAAPKRKPSAYNLFVNAKRAEIAVPKAHFVLTNE